MFIQTEDQAYRQMYGNDNKWLKPVGGIRLIAYNGETIPCLGYIEMSARYLEGNIILLLLLMDTPLLCTTFQALDVSHPRTGSRKNM